MAFEINKKVAIKDGFNGIVRYIGKVDGKSGEWVGIELDSPIGSNDGSYRGRQYFTCPPKCGVFVRTSRLVSEGANTDTENYVIREREYVSSSLNIPNHLEYPELFSVSRTSEIDQVEHNGIPSGKEIESNHTLFPQVQNDNDSTVLLCNMGLAQNTAGLEAENRDLKEQVSKYKELLCTVFSSCKTGLVKISTELESIQSRLACLKQPITSPGEKILVASIVGELYREYKKGNKKQVSILYRKFMSIIGKYNLSVN
ncbi:hypothetical protein PAEPH01_0421 [Pancytospora epiphaga]|nr:hypothetical protein PAEPH01_0421 [Pancytospora epiphaga]